MSTSALDKNHDWTFGRGRANYINEDQEIAQNIKTRIQSFTRDWFLDTSANIDWITLLGSFNTKKQIELEIERVTKSTEGVLKIDHLEMTVDKKTRSSIVKLQVTTIYSQSLNINIGVGI